MCWSIWDRRWKVGGADLGNVTLNEELNEAIARGVAEELRGADLGHLANHRDDLLLALLQLKADADRLP
jgi:carnitine 3-dehydrogenase